MRSRVCAIAMVALLLCSGLAIADPLVYTGVVTVDTVTAKPGDHFSVPIRLMNNNASLSAMFIPLKFAGSGLVYDSISQEGSDLPADFSAQAGYSSTEGVLRIMILPGFQNPVPTTSLPSGTLCVIHFHLTAQAALGITSVDSVYTDTLISGVTQEVRITFADNTGTQAGIFYPGYVKGAIIVTAPTGVDDGGGSLPIAFNLGQNYPNPFNPTTMINYTLPNASHVKLEVFNVLGQRVAMLADTKQTAGDHSTEFNATSYPSGIYFYRLTYDGGVATRKMVLLK